MAAQFSRSTRSLKNDRGLVGFVVLIGAAIVIAAWLAWFFFAPIALYETSSTFSVRRDGMLMVTFPETAHSQILPGQKAIFVPATSENEFGSSIPALVMDTPASRGRRDGVVYVYLETSAPLTDDLAGELRIEVEQVSPFTLILRSRN